MNALRSVQILLVIIIVLCPQNVLHAQQNNAVKTGNYVYLEELAAIQADYLKHELSLTSKNLPFRINTLPLYNDVHTLDYVIRKISRIDELNAKDIDVNPTLKIMVQRTNAKNKAALQIYLNQHAHVRQELSERPGKMIALALDGMRDDVLFPGVTLEALMNIRRQKQFNELVKRVTKLETDYDPIWADALVQVHKEDPSIAPFMYTPLRTNPWAAFARLMESIEYDNIGEGSHPLNAIELDDADKVYKITIEGGAFTWRYMFKINPILGKNVHLSIDGKDGIVQGNVHDFDHQYFSISTNLNQGDNDLSIRVQPGGSGLVRYEPLDLSTKYLSVSHVYEPLLGSGWLGAGATVFIWTGDASKVRNTPDSEIEKIHIGGENLRSPKGRFEYEQELQTTIENEIREKLSEPFVYSGIQVNRQGQPVPIQATLQVDGNRILGTLKRPASGSISRIEGTLTGDQITFQEAQYDKQPAEQYKQIEGYGGTYKLTYVPSGVYQRFMGASDHSLYTRLFTKKVDPKVERLFSSPDHTKAVSRMSENCLRWPALLNVSEYDPINGTLVADFEWPNDSKTMLKGFIGDQEIILYTEDEKDRNTYWYVLYSDVYSHDESLPPVAGGRAGYSPTPKCIISQLSFEILSKEELKQVLLGSGHEFSGAFSMYPLQGNATLVLNAGTGEEVSGMLKMGQRTVKLKGEFSNGYLILHGDGFGKGRLLAKEGEPFEKKQALVFWYEERENGKFLVGTNRYKRKNVKQQAVSFFEFSLASVEEDINTLKAAR